MYYTPHSSLSWQTGILRFKNKSLDEVKQMLENQYDTRILLYHEILSQQPETHTNQSDTPVNQEIRLVLYINYEPGTDNLKVMGRVS